MLHLHHEAARLRPSPPDPRLVSPLFPPHLPCPSLTDIRVPPDLDRPEPAVPSSTRMVSHFVEQSELGDSAKVSSCPAGSAVPDEEPPDRLSWIQRYNLPVFFAAAWEQHRQAGQLRAERAPLRLPCRLFSFGLSCAISVAFAVAPSVSVALLHRPGSLLPSSARPHLGRHLVTLSKSR